MYYRTSNEAEKAKLTEQMKEAACFLFTVSNLLKSKRFQSWLVRPEVRFDWADQAVLERLQKELSFQLRQAIDIREAKDQPTVLQLIHFAGLLSDAANDIEGRFGFTVKQKDTKLVVPKGESFSEHLYAFLSHKDIDVLRNKNVDFYLRNALDALVIYTRARETMECDTGNQVFEKLLDSLKSDYLIKGYLHDILCHDAHLCRTKQNVRALLVRKSYCSSFAVFRDEDVPAVHDDFRVIQMKRAA